MSLFRPSAAVCCSADDVISTCCSKCDARPLQREDGGRDEWEGRGAETWEVSSQTEL